MDLFLQIVLTVLAIGLIIFLIAAKAQGLSFNELVKKIIDLGLKGKNLKWNFMNKKIVNNKLLFVSYEAVGIFLNIHV